MQVKEFLKFWNEFLKSLNEFLNFMNEFLKLLNEFLKFLIQFLIFLNAFLKFVIELLKFWFCLQADPEPAPGRPGIKKTILEGWGREWG